MKQPFPTVWYQGNVASFWVGKHLVCVPLKFGSSDRAEHFIPLLYRLWQEQPFSVRKGVLVQRYTKQVDGVRKEVEENVAHRLFAAYARQDIGFEWTEVTAKNGNFLCLTRENIVPVRNPAAPATDAEKLHRVDQQFRERILEQLAHERLFEKYEQRFKKDDDPDPYRVNESYRLDTVFEIFMKFGAKFLREQIDVLSTEQLTHLQTEWVKNTLAIETRVVADLTREDVEKQNFFERQVFLMTRPELAGEAHPANYPDGVVHTRPANPTKTIGWHDENGEGGQVSIGSKRLSGDNMVAHCSAIIQSQRSGEEARHRIKNVRTENDHYRPFTKHSVRRDDDRADLQGHWNDPSTEAVLNRHGWVTPANGGKPRYEGKGFNGVGEQVSRVRG